MLENPMYTADPPDSLDLLQESLDEIEQMAGQTEPDNQVAMVLALCEIARQLGRIGDILKCL